MQTSEILFLQLNGFVPQNLVARPTVSTLSFRPQMDAWVGYAEGVARTRYPNYAAEGESAKRHLEERREGSERHTLRLCRAANPGGFIAGDSNNGLLRCRSCRRLCAGHRMR